MIGRPLREPRTAAVRLTARFEIAIPTLQITPFNAFNTFNTL
jgi:hypothetical protein